MRKTFEITGWVIYVLFWAWLGNLFDDVVISVLKLKGATHITVKESIFIWLVSELGFLLIGILFLVWLTERIKSKRKFGRWNKPTLEKIKEAVGQFSDQTFGKERSYISPLKHLEKEVIEIQESGKMSEYADAQLLLLDSFRKRFPGVHTDVLLQECATKIEINKTRKWSQPDKDGVFEHVE